MLDILMAYRLTGVTVFTEDEFDDQSSRLDLDDDQNDNEPTKKQIGIRIETFAQGKAAHSVSSFYDIFTAG